jgi:hypothetical protein
MRERQSWLQMGKMKAKVPRRRAGPTVLAARELAEQSDRQSDMRSGGGLLRAHPGPLQQREISVSRARRFSPRLLVPVPLIAVPLIAVPLIAVPLAPAAGQNLDAGKPASQIFAEVCANCHRGPREFRSNPGASFLREHYTTGSEMAATMAAYISGGGSAPGGPQPKRQPNPAAGAGAAARDTPAPDGLRDPRRAPPDPKTESRTEAKTDPKVDPKADPKADPNARAVPASAAARPRPGSVVRAEGTAEVKPPAPPTPARPVLEEFEE